MIRFFQILSSLLAWTGIVVMTIGWTTLIALVSLISPWVDPDRRICHQLASLWGRGLIRLASSRLVQVSGIENIPKHQPVIFVANHQSYVDVPLLFSIPSQFKWMADVDLFRIPFFGWAMKMAGYIPVDRGNARQGLLALQRAQEWLKRRISIFVFPEGTRSHTGVLGRFQTGAFRLAVKTRTSIVPVVVLGTRQLLPRSQWTFRWGVHLKIHVLAPISSIDAGSPRELAHRVRVKMRQEFARMLPCRIR